VWLLSWQVMRSWWLRFRPPRRDDYRNRAQPPIE